MRLRLLLAVALILAAGLCVYKFTRPSERRHAQKPQAQVQTLPAERGRNRFEQYMESAPSDAVPGRFIVLSDSDSDFEAFNASARKAGVEVVAECAALRLSLVAAADELARGKLSAALLSRSLLEYDFVSHAPESTLTSNVPDPFGRDAGRAIGCPDDPAWGRGVSVALLDDAVVSHPELANSSVVRFAEGDAAKTGAHGTAMASLLCGGGESVKGVIRGARILNFVVCDESGSGDSFRIARAISDAIDAGAGVICCERLVSSDSQALRTAVRRAVESNVLVVAPVPTSGGVVYPSAIPEVLSVAAVDRSGAFIGRPEAGFSLVAPGSGLAVALPGGAEGNADGAGPASVLVAGSIAGILSENPGLGAYPAANLVRDYADRSGLDNETGSGIVNVARVRGRTMLGVRDIAVTGVDFVPDGKGGGKARVAVQNKGTATAPFTLEVTSGGRVYRFPNTGLAANQFAVYNVDIPDGGDGQISVNAVTPSPDANPDNNVW